jgi:competence protein ComFC
MKLKELFFDLIFPPVCLVCRQKFDGGRTERRNNPLCDNCAGRIEVFSGFYCPRCGRRIPPVGPVKSCHAETGFILAAATAYRDPVARELIHALKYAGVRSALIPIAKILGAYLDDLDRNGFFGEKFPAGRSVIVPIPLHPKKERERGFNQAFLIAGAVGQRFGLPVEAGNLQRTKNTAAQAELTDREARATNMSGAFALKYPEKLAGKNVILVDDVFTSGATMAEAVGTLKNTGVKRIIALVIAKA